MNQIKHSLSDWDFPSPTYLAIRTDQYVSAPSSLKGLLCPSGSINENVWLKSALAPCVKDGRFVDWYRWNASAYMDKYILFRAQDVPPLAIPQDCYWLHLRNDYVRLYTRIAGVANEIATGHFIPDLSANTWYRFRMTFYSYLGADLVEVMRAIFEIEIAGEWVEKFNIEDSANLHKDSEVNRIGFMLRVRYATLQQWVDDTEIWKKTE